MSRLCLCGAEREAWRSVFLVARVMGDLCMLCAGEGGIGIVLIVYWVNGYFICEGIEGVVE